MDALSLGRVRILFSIKCQKHMPQKGKANGNLVQRRVSPQKWYMLSAKIELLLPSFYLLKARRSGNL